MASLNMSRLRRVFLPNAFLVMLTWTIPAAYAQERLSYQLGTATTSELSHAVGVTLAALVKLKLLPAEGIDLNAQNTSGSSDNARLLGQGDLDFAILTSLDTRDVANRQALSEDSDADSNLRLLTSLWQETYYIIARRDVIPEGRFADLLALQGIRASFGEQGTRDLAIIRAFLSSFDVPIDDAFDLQDLSSQEAATAFLEGELDVVVLTSSGSDVDLSSFLDEAGEAAVVLDVSDDDLEAANGRGYPAWSSVPVSAGVSTDQETVKRTIAIDYQLGAAAAVDDEVVYQITKTIFDNLPILSGMHGATESISLENAFRQVFLPIHPGAERYYSEIGLELPVIPTLRISNLTAADFVTRFSSIQEARLRLSADNISILGGQDGHTIGRFTSELADDLKDLPLRIASISSPDPVNNIAQVLYAKGIDSALVPLDVLDYAIEEDIYPGIKDKVVYTTELFPQEFHLITTPDITTIDDLVDKPVGMGTKDSSSAFTASFLFDALNIPVEPVYIAPRRALGLLRSGELAAVVVIAGKPAPLLLEEGYASDLRLLEVPPLEGSPYRKAEISAAEYPGMMAAGSSIDTFAVRTALITYNWRTSNQRYAALSTFIAALFDKLSSLQGNSAGLHPKWNDINPFAEIEDLSRFGAAQSWLDRDRGASETN